MIVLRVCVKQFLCITAVKLLCDEPTAQQVEILCDTLIWGQSHAGAKQESVVAACSESLCLHRVILRVSSDQRCLEMKRCQSRITSCFFWHYNKKTSADPRSASAASLLHLKNRHRSCSRSSRCVFLLQIRVWPHSIYTSLHSSISSAQADRSTSHTELLLLQTLTKVLQFVPKFLRLCFLGWIPEHLELWRSRWCEPDAGQVDFRCDISLLTCGGSVFITRCHLHAS